MHRIADRLRRIVAFDRGSGRWVVGLVVAAAAALLLWFGMGLDRGSPEAGIAPASTGGDILPPAEEDIDHAAAPGSPDSQPQYVIPPAEP